MENIPLIIVALNNAIKYYFSIPGCDSRSLVVLLLSLLVGDIERIIEGKAVKVYEEDLSPLLSRAERLCVLL